jgi:hypothetical protein
MTDSSASRYALGHHRVERPKPLMPPPEPQGWRDRLEREGRDRQVDRRLHRCLQIHTRRQQWL